ncbi:MAG: hypothetical protein HY445_01365 [Candidatus Niyogibacteria bacterium]|nr:hypothetical protein [Candidatus Niyogibacteria bacterium]
MKKEQLIPGIPEEKKSLERRKILSNQKEREQEEAIQKLEKELGRTLTDEEIEKARKIAQEREEIRPYGE